jgi:TnpA family transposase
MRSAGAAATAFNATHRRLFGVGNATRAIIQEQRKRFAASTTLSRSRRLRHSFFECIAWNACFDAAGAFIQMAAQSHVLGGKK